MIAARAPEEDTEDLVDVARRAAAYAPLHCTDCCAYHGSWPALRLVGAVGGIECDRHVLIPILAELARASSNDRWLIAGMSDTGLLATSAVALRKEGAVARILLIDRCETPLRLCTEHGRRTGLDVETIRTDLIHYAPSVLQRVVFAHSVLSHLPAEMGRRALGAMRSWLAPGGNLLLVARVNDEPDRKVHAAEVEPDYIQAVLSRLSGLGLEDEETLERLREWLPVYFMRRGKRTATFASVADLKTQLHENGFGTVDIRAEFRPADRSLRRFTRTQQRVVVLARAD